MRRPRLFDYYRQFEALGPEEESRRLRRMREEQRSRELELAPVLDLSRAEWPEPPDPEIVNSATFALRRAINRYPDASGSPAREAIAGHHGIDAGRIAAGHGAAQLIQAAVRRLAAGGSVAIPWPSWSALPGLVARAGARPVLVPGGPDPERLAAAAGDVRAVVLCSPNDPTGALVDAGSLRALADRLGPDVAILLDEALVEFAGSGASAVPLTAELPTLLVFRSFSKAWALAGLRAGYVVSGEGGAGFLGELGPGLGVAAPSLAAMSAALEPGGRALRRLDRRLDAVAAERRRLERMVQDLPVRAEPTAAHLVWLSHDGLDGASLAHELAEQRILVAPGAEWGDERHVRIALRDRPSTERLVSALRTLTGSH